MNEIARADIERTYRQYFQIVRDKCARMLRDPTEAQDVAQETFARLWIRRGDIADARAVVAWLYRTSTRIAVDSYRRGRHQRRAPLDEEAGEGVPTGVTGDATGRMDAIRLLEQIAGGAPARELEVVILCRVDELSHDEIAEITGTSSRTVRRLLARFDQRLARWSGADGRQPTSTL